MLPAARLGRIAREGVYGHKICGHGNTGDWKIQGIARVCCRGVCMGENQRGHITEQADPLCRATDINDDLSLRTAQLQILSRALSNVTHDIQNHLAAISESAGWMEDLLKLKSKKSFGRIRRFFKKDDQHRMDVGPFSNVLHTIQEQVAHGSTLNQHLNSFVHRLEATRCVFSGNKALAEIRDVLLKEAEERSVYMEIKLADANPMIETDPPGFQLAVFCCAEAVMQGLKGGDRVILQAEVGEGRLYIHLTAEWPSEGRRLPSGKSDGLDFCRNIVEKLGGRICNQPGDEKPVTSLAFPLAGGTHNRCR